MNRFFIFFLLSFIVHIAIGGMLVYRMGGFGENESDIDLLSPSAVEESSEEVKNIPASPPPLVSSPAKKGVKKVQAVKKAKKTPKVKAVEAVKKAKPLPINSKPTNKTVEIKKPETPKKLVEKATDEKAKAVAKDETPIEKDEKTVVKSDETPIEKDEKTVVKSDEKTPIEKDEKTSEQTAEVKPTQAPKWIDEEDEIEEQKTAEAKVEQKTTEKTTTETAEQKTAEKATTETAEAKTTKAEQTPVKSETAEATTTKAEQTPVKSETAEAETAEAKAEKTGPVKSSKAGATASSAKKIRTHKQLKQRKGNKAPPYPKSALKKKWEGRVEIMYYVNPAGFVEKIQLSKSSGHSVLDNSALRALARYRYHPGQEGWVTHPVEFLLEWDKEIKETAPLGGFPQRKGASVK